MRDFLLNLEVELIGLFVTVFIIDRIIKRQEKRRWTASRNYVYAQLLEMVNDFLRDALPVEARSLPAAFYYYGDISVLPIGDVDQRVLCSLSDSLDRELGDKREFRTDSLRALETTIDDTLDKWMLVIEPEEVDSLLRLAHQLRIVRMCRVDWRDPTDVLGLVGHLAPAVRRALVVMEWLKQKADSKVNVDDLLPDN